jgi:hypothetical protein
MVRAAVAYPLWFPEVSAVLLGTKTAAQAESNFGEIPGARLSTASLRRVLAFQDELDLGDRRSLRSLAKRVLGRFRASRAEQQQPAREIGAPPPPSGSSC